MSGVMPSPSEMMFASSRTGSTSWYRQSVGGRPAISRGVTAAATCSRSYRASSGLPASLTPWTASASYRLPVAEQSRWLSAEKATKVSLRVRMANCGVLVQRRDDAAGQSRRRARPEAHLADEIVGDPGQPRVARCLPDRAVELEVGVAVADGVLQQLGRLLPCVQRLERAVDEGRRTGHGCRVARRDAVQDLAQLVNLAHVLNVDLGHVVTAVRDRGQET